MAEKTLQPIDSMEFPRFTQPATFFRTPLKLDGKGLDIAVIGVPFDFQTNRPGARHGPAQIREMSRLIRRFNAQGGESPFDLCNIADAGDAPVNPLDPYDSIKRISAFCADLAARGTAILAAGGDHGATYPVWKGTIKSGTVGVIHFDAHPDTYHGFWGNTHNHGTLLRNGVEEGLIDPKRVITIGLRGTRFALDDRDYHRDFGMRLISMDDYEAMGREAVIKEIHRVVGKGPAYVTFDVDGLDPAYCVGTGAPEPGGIMMRDAQVMLRSLRGLEIIGGDLCEVSPPLDPSGHTALNGANLMFEILCAMAETVARRKAGKR
jgi:guanidinopropionase